VRLCEGRHAALPRGVYRATPRIGYGKSRWTTQIEQHNLDHRSDH
jgi:hypothetical protein